MSLILNPHRFELPSGPASAAFRNFHASSTAKTNRVQTITGVDFGAAATGRYAFCIVHWMFDNKSLASATIGGVPAAIAVQTRMYNSTTGALGAAIISAPLAAGTTATVALTFASGGSNYWAYVGSFRVTGLVSPTPIDTANAIDQAPSTSKSKTLNVNVAEDGFVLAAMGPYGTGDDDNISGATERYNRSLHTKVRAFGASLNTTADQSNRALTFTRGGVSSYTMAGPYVAASFR